LTDRSPERRPSDTEAPPRVSTLDDMVRLTPRSRAVGLAVTVSAFVVSATIAAQVAAMWDRMLRTTAS